ncbi:MAG: hypothetical protein NTX03_07765 [Bacteroidetes bacterium]|nr:hypothetical protein [Bacteroidota bacterium]
MKKKLMMLAMLMSLSFTLMLSSCVKNNNPVDDLLDTDAQEAAGDYSEADKAFSDAFDATFDATANHPGLFKTNSAETMLLTDCATVTVEDSVSATKKYKITFGNGTDSCLGKDGRNRIGTLRISITDGKFRTLGSKIVIKTDGYYVNGVHIQGTKTVNTYAGTGGADLIYKIIINGEDGSEYAIITRKDGKVHKWKATVYNEVYFMSSTSIVDYCLHSGNGVGVASNGKSYTVNITNKLKSAPGCKWIEQGTIEITPEGKAKRVIDFGKGTCDGLATLTVGKKTYQFVMR